MRISCHVTRSRSSFIAAGDMRMRLRFNPTLTRKELATLAGGLAVAVLMYVVLVHPSVQLYADLDDATAAHQQATGRLERLHAELDRLEAEIATFEKRLEALGGAPPDESRRDHQIARLTSLAQQCGIRVDQYAPVGTVNHGDYRRFTIHFVGRGTFGEVREYFSRVEREIDFVDLTHFQVAARPTDGVSECRIEWSCQINGMISEPQDPPGFAPRASQQSDSMEVALHGS